MNADSSSEVGRHEERYERVEQRLSIYLGWLRTLRNRVEKGLLTPQEMDRMIARSMVARDLMLERKKDKDKIDYGTGLFNKKEFDKQFGELIEKGAQFGLLIIDVDSFKKINDSHGHLAGNSILAQLGQTLVASTRQTKEDEVGNDLVARYSEHSDEFLVLLKGLSKTEDLKRIAEKFRLAVHGAPLSVVAKGEKLEIDATISIGGGIYTKGKSGQEFFDEVDTSLIQAKQKGKNTSVII